MDFKSLFCIVTVLRLYHNLLTFIPLKHGTMKDLVLAIFKSKIKNEKKISYYKFVHGMNIKDTSKFLSITSKIKFSIEERLNNISSILFLYCEKN